MLKESILIDLPETVTETEKPALDELALITVLPTPTEVIIPLSTVTMLLLSVFQEIVSVAFDGVIVYAMCALSPIVILYVVVETENALIAISDGRLGEGSVTVGCVGVVVDGVVAGGVVGDVVVGGVVGDVVVGGVVGDVVVGGVVVGCVVVGGAVVSVVSPPVVLSVVPCVPF